MIDRGLGVPARSVEEALAASQQQSPSRILPEQLEAYLRAKVKRGFSLPPATEAGQVPRGMLLPASPNIDYNKPLMATLDPYRKGSEDVLAAAKSPEVQDAVHAAIEGMVGTGPGGAMSGMIRGGKAFTWSKISGVDHFSNNEKLSPEMENVYGYGDPKTKVLTLKGLFTGRSFQFQGGGEESLLRLAQEAKEKGYKTIDVPEAVGSAFDFYQKLGFKATAAPQWIGDHIPMRAGVDDLLANLEVRGVQSKYPAMRQERTKAEIDAIRMKAEAAFPMIVNRSGPAHAKFEYYEPLQKQPYFTLEKPILDAFGAEQHPAGSTLSRNTLRKYGFDIRKDEAAAARIGSTPEGIAARKKSNDEFRDKWRGGK